MRAPFPFCMTAFYGVDQPQDYLASGFLWLVVYLAPLTLGAFAVYKGFSGPLRRKEQTRMFLDLLEAGFRHGQRPETTLTQAAETLDPALGHRFQRLASHLQDGARLSQALQAVPNLLPPQVTATLRVGEEVGDVRKVLPACRNLLRDADSRTRNGFNFLVISSMVIAMPCVLFFITRLLLPKIFEIWYGFSNSDTIPAPIALLKQMGYWAVGAQFLAAFVLWWWILFYIRGPRAIFVFRPMGKLRDQILYAMPWRRRRLQRDFCSTLSILLDAETPEPAAITLAAEATANDVFVKRARLALQDLGAGQTLQSALRRFDKADEFGWRLANAASQEGGFLPALAGWIEALDAKAFQQEQAASQLITTGLILYNGLVVGLIARGLFAVLVSIEG